MIKETINRLVEGKPISRTDAFNAVLEIMNGDATPAQIGAFLAALRIRGETPDVIAGAAEAMRSKFTAIPIDKDVVVDTCGTGGDGAHTFNISTAAAFVTAGAGVTVAKHGNRSVSSKCGSADVLAALGVKITVPPETMIRSLQQIGIAFLFAPTLHPAMKHAIGPRRELGMRSIFNILGPLCNPAGARYGVLGVYSPELAPVLAEAAAALGAVHLFVVHGHDGLDEITTTTGTLVCEVVKGRINTFEFEPAGVGIPTAEPGDLTGGTPDENARIINEILSGRKGPHRDIVLLNSAAAIVAAGVAPDFESGLKLAAESVDSGKALQKLNQLIAVTNG